MSQEHTDQPTGRTSYASLGMAIGLVFGGAIGHLLGNIVFAGGGMVIGYAAGSALDRRKSEDGTRA